MNARPDPLEDLAARLEALENRVQALESARPTAGPVPLAARASETPVSSWPEPLPQFTSVFPVLGSALLGIAGAYLLRAISGASLLPRTIVALIAALYAGAWLLAAARFAARRKVAGVLYAAVSILILAPMLAEMTIRFEAMQGTTACVILALYVAAAAALGLGRGGKPVFSVAFAGSAIAAVALSIGTHAMLPFTFLLLAMLAFCELQTRKLAGNGLRPVVALAADIGVWTLLLIYRLPPTGRADYPAVPAAMVLAAALLLFGLELASVARQAMVRGEPISLLSIGQAMISFAIAAAALVWLVPGHATTVLGSLCLALSASCYAAAYGAIRRAENRRNFNVLNIWAAGLLLGAAFLLVPGSVASAALGSAAVAAIAAARRIHSKALAFHGLVLLLVAAAGSGLLVWAAQVLAGSYPAAPGAAVLVVGLAAVLAYAAGEEEKGEEWLNQAMHLVLALLAAFATAAILVLGLFDAARLLFRPEAHHLALIRTLGLCILAAGLAFAGARLRRPAMTRIAYAVIAFVTAKLVFEDLRLGHMEFIAGSIFALAVTLIAAPRLTKAGSRNVESRQ